MVGQAVSWVQSWVICPEIRSVVGVVSGIDEQDSDALV